MKVYRSQSSHRAFSLIELLIIVAIVAILTLLFMSSKNATNRARRINCINNLKQVGLAFPVWKDKNGTIPIKYRTNNFDGPSYMLQQKTYVYFQAMSNKLSTPKFLCCPGDDRLPATNFVNLSNTNISYFVGMDADETMPQTLLAGDQNLTINGVPASAGTVNIKSTDLIAWTSQMHQGQGNVALADGSVQGMRRVPRQPGTNIVQLAIP